MLLRRLQVDTYLTVPTEIFLNASVCTLVVAIPAIKPKVSIGTFSDENIDNKNNHLFFRNFHESSIEDYERAVVRLLKIFTS